MITIASGKVSTQSHSLIALTPKKLKTYISNETDCFEGGTQKNPVCVASICHCCALLKHFVFSRKQQFSFLLSFFFFKETIVLNSLFMINCSCWTDFFFFSFKNYGSDGILSPSLLNQMIRKRLKLFKQSFCVGVSEYASHME